MNPAPAWYGEAVGLREIAPRGVLFLCAANSARSQMAEAIARALAPVGVKIWSAGSQPTMVRPEALAVLAEIGLDATSHFAKHVSAIPADQVEVVITLCAEQECPVFPGRARRVHWPLPDPAACHGDDATRLDAFRAVRDELGARLTVVFGVPA